MAPAITWIGHASFKLTGSKTIYIDPWKIAGSPHDADVILISHNHYDHFSLFDIERLQNNKTLIFGPRSVINELQRGNPFKPGDKASGAHVRIVGIPAYNKKSPFHPREKEWLGFLIRIDSKVIYYTGDTAIIPEMQLLPAIDVALIPVSGIHSLDPKLAIEACGLFRPKHAIPYHWGDILGSKADAEYFCDYVKSTSPHLLLPGETFEIP